MPNGEPQRPVHDLRTAASKIHDLERAGLGRLDWIGPEWIGTMADIDPTAFDYLVDQLRRDKALHDRIRACKDRATRCRNQKHAIRETLEYYVQVTGKPVGANLRFIVSDDIPCPPATPRKAPQTSR